VVADVLQIPAVALPEVDYDWFARACRFVREAIRAGLVSAARDISDGGAPAAVVEMAFGAADRGTALGVLFADTERSQLWRFEESPGFVLEVASESLDAVAALALRHGIATQPIAVTFAEPMIHVLSRAGEFTESIPVAELREVWEAPLRDFYGS
jgi:phosphoribosylformylglycinamidine (FGAM) synthase-like enzyme